MTKKEKIAEYDKAVKELIKEVEAVYESKTMTGEVRVDCINELIGNFRDELSGFSSADLTIDWNKLIGGAEPCFEFGDGPVYLQLGKDGGTIEYGTVCNTGMLVDGVYEFDFDETYQYNLQQLQEVLEEKYGQMT